VRLVARQLPEATLCFMHPVKAEEAIVEAYWTHGVRTFSLDTMDELQKILRATRERDRPQPAACGCACRRIMPSSASRPSSARSRRDQGLLFATRQAADALGICFHVGSQAMTPAAYAGDAACARRSSRRR
jgi:ornithine decarboxylase